MSRRQQLMRPHQSVLLPPEVPVFWIETNQPGQVEFYVDANPGTIPTLYRIQYSTSSVFEVDVQEITTVSTGYQSLFLPPGIEYYFQARAERDDLISPWIGVTGGTVPALGVEQTSADAEFAYASWSTIPLAEGYSYDIDGGGFNFTTDTSLTLTCYPGQTASLTVVARLGADYGLPTTMTLYGLPLAPSVSLGIGERDGMTSLEYSVSHVSYFSQIDWQLGYYNEYSEFQGLASGTFYGSEGSYFPISDYPELYDKTFVFSATATYYSSAATLSSETATTTYSFV